MTFYPSLRVSAFLSTVGVSLSISCSSPDAGPESGKGGDGDTNNNIDLGSGGTTNTGKPMAVVETTLPAGFSANTQAPQSWECGGLPGAMCFQPRGGFLRVGALSDVALEASNSCRNVLRGIVRDFEASHPDFGGDTNGDGVDAGLVQNVLGDNRKPIPTNSSNVATALADWFENSAGGNVPYVVDFWLEPVGDFFIFDSSRFFPVDGVGTLSGKDNDGVDRNFLFTTELHTAFEYKGGEVFTFTGDDDVFIYINNVLAVDLGGVHSQFSGSVNIDTFAQQNGMMIGQVYTLDLFHAERNPTGSNFHIETSLDFKECGVLEDDIIVR